MDMFCCLNFFKKKIRKEESSANLRPREVNAASRSNITHNQDQKVEPTNESNNSDRGNIQEVPAVSDAPEAVENDTIQIITKDTARDDITDTGEREGTISEATFNLKRRNENRIETEGALNAQELRISHDTIRNSINEEKASANVIFENISYNVWNKTDFAMNFKRLTEFLQTDDMFVYTLIATPIDTNSKHIGNVSPTVKKDITIANSENIGNAKAITVDASAAVETLDASVAVDTVDASAAVETVDASAAVDTVDASATVEKDFQMPDRVKLDTAKDRPTSEAKTIHSQLNVPNCTSTFKVTTAVPCVSPTTSQPEPVTYAAIMQTKPVNFLEIISLERVQRHGYIVNGKVHVALRAWNCMSGKKVAVFCEVCRVSVNINNKVGHTVNGKHVALLAECRPLKEFGLALVRQVEVDRYHCAVCNGMFTLAEVRAHTASARHVRDLEAAMKSAVELLNDDHTRVMDMSSGRPSLRCLQLSLRRAGAARGVPGAPGGARRASAASRPHPQGPGRLLSLQAVTQHYTAAFAHHNYLIRSYKIIMGLQLQIISEVWNCQKC